MEKYGVWAIYGRPLYLHEVKAMNTAQNVYDAYMAREASGNWAEWAEKNPTMSAVLNRAMKNG